MVTSTLKYFKFYRHLPEERQKVSRAFCELAELMEKEMPQGAEKSAGMRKLLEAKDCFMRSALDKE